MNINVRIKEKLKNKINQKIFLGILLISFVVIGINTYRKVTETNYKTREKIERAYNGVNKKLDLLNMSLYDFKSDNTFIKYLFDISDNRNKSAYSKAILFGDLRKRNNVSGKIGYSINITDFVMDHVLTPMGSRDKDSFYRELEFPRDIEKRKKYISEEKNNINIFFEDKATVTKSPIFWIISIDKDDFFMEFMSEADNWYIMNEDVLINFGKNRKKIDEIRKKIENIINVGNLNREIVKNETIKRVLKKKAHIFYEPSLDIVIFYLQPLMNIPGIIFIEAVKVYSVLGILYGMFLIILSFIVKPIKQLAEKMGYIKNDGEKEIEYIEHKIDEIEVLNKNLQDRVTNLRNYQRKKKIKDYLIGVAENNDISLLIEESEIFKVESYRVMILEIYDIDSVENIFDKFNMSKELILKYFSEEVRYEVIDIDYKSVAFIMEEHLTKEELEEVLNCLVRHIERNFGLKFTVAVSNSCNEIQLIPKIYRASKKILDYKYIFKQDRVIFQERIKESNFSKYYYPVDLESKLILRTLSANEISIKRIINEMFGEKNNQPMDKKYVKEFGMLLYNTLNRIFLQLKDMNEDINMQEFNINEILDIENAEQLKEIFQSKILAICKIMKVEEENDVESIKIKMERYLEDNYMIDISLENLADYLGYSFKYTSVLFKKLMGDNFKNYLSIYRIEKAKELMQEHKELKIKELAELVGYNSSNSFIRIFRKYEGVSPGKYFGIGE